MGLKKNKKYDLESRRPLFFGIGMVISLSLTLVAFEWKSPVGPVVDLNRTVISCSFDGLEVPDPILEFHPPSTQWTNNGKVITNDLSYQSSSYNYSDSIITSSCGPPLYFPRDLFHTEGDIHMIVEVMPSFNGGIESLNHLIQKKIKYPDQARRLGLEGKVFVQFVVEKDGSLTDIQVVKSIGAGCDEEAIRVLKLLPNYTPGKQRGVPVKVKMRLPVHFRLH